MAANITYGIVCGLVMLTIGSVGSPTLRNNHRLRLWKANDPFGRLAFAGMIVFCISVLAKAVRHFT